MAKLQMLSNDRIFFAAPCLSAVGCAVGAFLGAWATGTLGFIGALDGVAEFVGFLVVVMGWASIPGVIGGAVVGLPVNSRLRSASRSTRRWMLLPVAAAGSVAVSAVLLLTGSTEGFELLADYTGHGFLIGCLASPVLSWLALVGGVTTPATAR